jgi:peptidoglycan hydrolase CwlO-like protein
MPSGDYSYTVELVGTIQNQLGKLTEAVDSLNGQTKDQAKEVKDIAKEIHGFKVGLTVAAAILSAVFAVSAAIIGFILNHLAEVVQAYITAKK